MSFFGCELRNSTEQVVLESFSGLRQLLLLVGVVLDLRHGVMSSAIEVVGKYGDLVPLQMRQVFEILQVGLSFKCPHMQVIYEAKGCLDPLTQICVVDLRQILHSFFDFLTQQSSLPCQNTKCQLVLLAPPHLPESEQCQGGTHKSDAERDHPVLCKDRQD